MHSGVSISLTRSALARLWQPLANGRVRCQALKVPIGGQGFYGVWYDEGGH